MIGERVLVARAQDGENHEEATVVDYYVLLISGDQTPSVVVDFDDGERLYLSALEPNVRRMPDDEPDEAPGKEVEPGEDPGAE